MSSNDDIHGGIKERLLGRMVGKVIQLYTKCLSFTFYDDAGIYSQPSNHPYIYVFWHNRIFTLGSAFRIISPETRVACLTSASKDGALLESVMNEQGIDAVRGSTSRRGRAAMVEMMRKIRGGHGVGISPDGPRGPVYELNPGVLKLAAATKRELVLVQADYSDYWELKTWDGFRIPKPFSRVTICFNAPQAVKKGLSEEEEQKLKSSIEETLKSSIKYTKDKSYAEYRW